MTKEQLKKHLGRVPNDDESLLISALQNSLKSHIHVTSESQYLEEGNVKPKINITMGGQSSSNKSVIDNDINFLLKDIQNVITFKSENGKLIVGNKPDTESSPSLKLGDRIYFLPDVYSLKPIIKAGKSFPGIRLQTLNRRETGFRLTQWLKGEHLGLSLEMESVQELSLLLANKKRGLMISGEEEDLASFFQNSLFQTRGVFYLGEIVDRPFFSVQYGEKRKVSLPTSLLFEMLPDAYSFSIPPNIHEAPIFTPYTIKEKKTYSKEVLTLLKMPSEDPSILVTPHQAKVDSTMAISNSLGFAVGCAINNTSHLNYIDPELKGMADLANAARQLVCRGIKPELASGNINFKSGDETAKLYLLGLRKASEFLRINLENFSVSVDSDNTKGWISAAGRGTKGQLPFTNTFKSYGDFISILGSHRGELGSSIFLKKYGNDTEGVVPHIDLGMEVRIQDAVFTGIQGQLIESASIISGGGLAVAIGKALKSTTGNLGARIHFSRKLRTDELLFGETQGLVVVSLNENNLMEFERVCMNIGVPTTTIGRVTDNGKYTFNDFVSISVKDIQTES